MFKWYRKETFLLNPKWHKLRWGLLIASVSILLIGWLFYTPPGFWGKMQGLGFAVCHQSPTHSFHAFERSMPLCARCTGMYLGALIAILMQITRRKERLNAFPKTYFLVFFGLFLAGFAVDGFNSLFAKGFNIHLYDTQNWMRLTTGLGVGWGMGAMVGPAIHQSVWKKSTDQPFFSKPIQILWLILFSAVPVAGMLLEIDIITAVFSSLAAMTVPFFLSFLHMLLVIMATFKENTFDTWQQLLPYWLTGLLVAFLQIYIFSWVRVSAFGTWDPFLLP